jgi:hypothetical protein
LIPDVPAHQRLRSPIWRQLRVDGLDSDIGRNSDAQQLIGSRHQIAVHVDQHLKQGAGWMIREIDDPPALRMPPAGGPQATNP